MDVIETACKVEEVQGHDQHQHTSVCVHETATLHICGSLDCPHCTPHLLTYTRLRLKSHLRRDSAAAQVGRLHRTGDAYGCLARSRDFGSALGNVPAWRAYLYHFGREVALYRGGREKGLPVSHSEHEADSAHTHYSYISFEVPNVSTRKITDMSTQNK